MYLVTGLLTCITIINFNNYMLASEHSNSYQIPQQSGAEENYTQQSGAEENWPLRMLLLERGRSIVAEYVAHL